MSLKLLFPCDYFNKNEVDEAYKDEYTVAKSLGFDCIFFDYDEFIQNKKLYIPMNTDNIGIPETGHTMANIMYRGWMLKLDDYELLTKLLWEKEYFSITPISLYETFHHFDEVYYYLRHFIDTPKIIVVNYDNGWMWFNSDIGYLPLNLREQFVDYFIMKDNVKSVKGTDFPSRISVNISENEFTELVEKFKKYRGDLYTGEIILKQHENLKRYNGVTNEWRVFYYLGGVMTVNRNSNQSDDCPKVPDTLINDYHLTDLTSMFYTLDFAETEDGRWILIEAGDGQVSGLCPNQNILEFYTKIQNYWNEKYNKED